MFKSDLDLEDEGVDASSNSDHDDEAEHAPDTLNTFDISKMPEDMREQFMAQMAQFRAYMVWMCVIKSDLFLSYAVIVVEGCGFLRVFAYNAIAFDESGTNKVQIMRNCLKCSVDNIILNQNIAQTSLPKIVFSNLCC